MSNDGKAKEAWKEEFLKSCSNYEAMNGSGRKIESLYDPSDVASLDYERDLGYPGEYPFTRGVYTSMHRGRVWTMRQFSGFGSGAYKS